MVRQAVHTAALAKAVAQAKAAGPPPATDSTVSRAESEYRDLLDLTMTQFRPMPDDRFDMCLALLEIIRNQAAAEEGEMRRIKTLPEDIFLIDVMAYALRDLRKIVRNQA